MVKWLNKNMDRWFLVEGNPEEVQRALIRALGDARGLHVAYRDEDAVTFGRHQKS